MTKIKETNEVETKVEEGKTEVKRKHEVKEGGALGETVEKEEYKEEQKAFFCDDETEKEFRNLLYHSGFDAVNVIRSPDPENFLCVIEAIPSLPQ